MLAALRSTQRALFAQHRVATIAFAEERDDDPQAVARALVGLRSATRNFDPERGYRFWTYAVHWLVHAIDTKVAPRHEFPGDAIGNALAKLDADGADLFRERAVVFSISVDDEVLRDSLGRIDLDCDGVSGDPSVALLATAWIVPLHETLSAYSVTLGAIAEAHGGRLVGWRLFDG